MVGTDSDSVQKRRRRRRNSVRLLDYLAWWRQRTHFGSSTKGTNINYCAHTQAHTYTRFSWCLWVAHKHTPEPYTCTEEPGTSSDHQLGTLFWSRWKEFTLFHSTKNKHTQFWVITLSLADWLAGWQFVLGYISFPLFTSTYPHYPNGNRSAICSLLWTRKIRWYECGT